jgi:hypothetical protein
MKTEAEIPESAEESSQPVDTRKYLPRAFGLLVNLDSEDVAFVEGTMFVAAQTPQGNAIDAAGTVKLPDQTILAFESLNELAQVTKWSQERMTKLVERFQKLLQS